MALAAVSACARPPKLPEVPAYRIPEPALRYIEERRARGLVTNIAWHASYEQDGLLIAVKTSFATSPVAGRFMREVEFILVRPTPEGPKIVTTSRQTFTTDPYGWSPGTLSAVDFRDYMIFATGWAHAANAHRVVGTTIRGRSLEAPIVNGFWFLWVRDHVGAELFSRVVVKDAQGNIIHTYPPARL